MLEIKVTVATAEDAYRAAAIFAGISAAYGAAPSAAIVSGVAGAALAEPATRTRKNKTADTASADPVAAYVAAGGALPADQPAAPATETPPATTSAPPAEPVAEAPAATIADEVAKVESAAATPSASFDEKCVELRALGRPHGVTWLRAVMKDNKVERISDLPESKIDELIADLKKAVAA